MDDLTPADKARYARHLTLPQIGEAGQAQLKASRVFSVGAGGLGSPALLYLAAAGVGHLTIIDDDTIERSNLQRQILHADEDVGASKAESAMQRLKQLNPSITIDVHSIRLTSENALNLLAGHDIVIDGTDNIPTRYLVSDACELLDIPWVYGSIYQFEGQVSVFNLNGGPNYRDLFPTPPPPEAEEPEPEGAQGDPGREAVPKPVTAPEPQLPRPRTTPVPRASSTGTADTSGATEQGEGTGRAGEGDRTGSGNGGGGQGGGVVVEPRLIRSITDASAFPVPPGGRQERIGKSVIVRLSVGASGRVEGCSIYRPSPFPETDAVVCSLAYDQIRFEPARDANGNAVPATFYYQQRFFN